MPSLRDSVREWDVNLGLASEAFSCHRSAVGWRWRVPAAFRSQRDGMYQLRTQVRGTRSDRQPKSQRDDMCSGCVPIDDACVSDCSTPSRLGA